MSQGILLPDSSPWGGEGGEGGEGREETLAACDKEGERRTAIGCDSPNGMLESVMGSSWIDKIFPSCRGGKEGRGEGGERGFNGLKNANLMMQLTHLLDASQPLELRCVDKIHQKWMELDGPVHGILEHLMNTAVEVWVMNNSEIRNSKFK